MLLQFLDSISPSFSLFLILIPSRFKSRPYLPRRLQHSRHEVGLEALGVQAASLERRAEVPDLHLADGVSGEERSGSGGIVVVRGVCSLFRRHFSSGTAKGDEELLAVAVARWSSEEKRRAREKRMLRRVPVAALRLSSRVSSDDLCLFSLSLFLFSTQTIEEPKKHPPVTGKHASIHHALLREGRNQRPLGIGGAREKRKRDRAWRGLTASSLLSFPLIDGTLQTQCFFFSSSLSPLSSKTAPLLQGRRAVRPGARLGQHRRGPLRGGREEAR